MGLQSHSWDLIVTIKQLPRMGTWALVLIYSCDLDSSPTHYLKAV